jgi:hypothetical protein
MALTSILLTRIYATTTTTFSNQSTADKRKKLQFVLYAAAQLFLMHEATALIFFMSNILWL